MVVIDEIQRKPELFPILRVLADRNKPKRKFLILGSASPALIKQSSESLAGRIGYVELCPFSLQEVGNINDLWVKGGFPLSYLNDDKKSILWRESYVRTFLEIDIPSLGFRIPSQQLYRFWVMLAHYHGQIFVAQEIAKALGISNHTARKYLDILEGTFMVRTLQPWFNNTKKRLIKTPKLYFRDSGILHTLLGINNKGF